MPATCLSSSYFRRGFNLIEAAIVLGVVGLVIGGIWVAASSVQRNMKESRLIEQVLLVTSNTRLLFKGMQPSDLALHEMDKSAWGTIFPQDMVTSEQYPQTPWGSMRVKINPDGGMPKGIAISLDDVPRSSCVSVAPKIANRARDDLWTETSWSSALTNFDGDDVATPALAFANCTDEGFHIYMKPPN